MLDRMPDEPTTPGQWQVIAWASIILFVIIGSVGLFYSYQVPPDKIDLARQLRTYSLIFYGMAAAMYAIKRLIAFFV